MLTRRDKDILRAIFTLARAGVNPGVQRVGKLLPKPLGHSTTALNINRLIDRGILIREPRTHGQGSTFRLSKEGLAMAQASGIAPIRPSGEFIASLVSEPTGNRQTRNQSPVTNPGPENPSTEPSNS